MQVKLIQRNIGGKRRFLAISVNGDVMRTMPTNGWLTEAAAKKWADKNGHAIVTVERMKDSVDAIREKYLGDSTEESTIDSIREKYQTDAPSKAEIAKYYRFLVVAEGMDGKMIRPSGGSYYRKYEDALRAAKSLEKPTTHHLFIEGEYADAPSMNHKALYTWRNPKAK